MPGSVRSISITTAWRTLRRSTIFSKWAAANCHESIRTTEPRRLRSAPERFLAVAALIECVLHGLARLPLAAGEIGELLGRAAVGDTGLAQRAGGAPGRGIVDVD